MIQLNSTKKMMMIGKFLADILLLTKQGNKWDEYWVTAKKNCISCLVCMSNELLIGFRQTKDELQKT